MGSSSSRNDLSRRHLLAIAAAGGLTGVAQAVSGGIEAKAAVPGFEYRTQAQHSSTGVDWGYPFTTRVERRYGVDGYPGLSYDWHKGVDYYTTPREGALIHSVAAGVVIASRDEGDVGRVRGEYVVVAHANGFTSEYAHMTHGSRRVSPGDYVARGTPLGQTGWTGYLEPKTPSNAHLHLSIRSNSESVLWNPVWLIDDAPLPGTDPTPHPSLEEYEEVSITVRVTDGGLAGVIYTLAPGFMSCAPDGPIGEFRAAHLNPSGQMIAMTEADLTQIMNAYQVPLNLKYDLLGGGSWSWARDAVSLLQEIRTKV